MIHTRRHTTPRRWVWLIAPLLLTFWLGARGLAADSPWIDEYHTLFEVGAVDHAHAEPPPSPPELWVGLGERRPAQTPGYFLALNGWGRLVGWEVAALRALSLFAGVLAVAATYRLGHDAVAPRAGLYGAVILGTSAFFIFYLHELRTYTLVTLLTPLAFWFYWRIMTALEVRPWHWLGLFGVSVALLYTQYYAALALVVIGVVHGMVEVSFSSRPHPQTPSPYTERGFIHPVPLVAPAPRVPVGETRIRGPLVRRWWAVVAVEVAAGLAFLPWFANLLTALGNQSAAAGLAARALTPPQILARLSGLFSHDTTWLLLGLLGLALWAALRRAALAGRVRWLWLATTLLLGAALLLNHLLPIMHAGRLRYLLGVWPLLALLVGVGLTQFERLRHGQRIAVGVLLAWGLVGVRATFDPAFADWDGTQYRFPLDRLAAVIAPTVEPGDTVVGLLGNTDHYNNGTAQLADLSFAPLPVRYVVTSQRGTSADPAAATLDWAAHQPRVWVASVPTLPDADFMTTIQTTHTHCETTTHATFQLDLYAAAPACCLNDAAAPLLTAPGGLTLSAASRTPDGVALAWRAAPDFPLARYNVSVQVFDPAGAKITQTDRGLADDMLACQSIPLDVPPDDYTVQVIVYEWETGARLSEATVSPESWYGE